MKLNAAIWGVALLCLTACTSGQVGTLPVVTKSDSATVYVVRRFAVVGMLNTFRIAYDKKNLFDIGNGDFGTFEVPPGSHDIAVKCFGGLLPIIQTHDLQQDFVAGKDYYFEVAPDTVACASIQAMSVDEGQVVKSFLTQVPLTNR